MSAVTTVAAASHCVCVSINDRNVLLVSSGTSPDKQHDDALLAFEQRPGLQQRVAGAELLFLDDELQGPAAPDASAGPL